MHFDSYVLVSGTRYFDNFNFYRDKFEYVKLTNADSDII